MSTDKDDVRTLAMEIYRLAWSELRRVKRTRRPEAQFYIEDLKEALLDLKQATISDDHARLWASIAEVAALRAELADELDGA